MTSERVQRVSDEQIADVLSYTDAGGSFDVESGAFVATIGDLRDARSDIQRLTAENAELRAQVATARRDGWIAGRDAALCAAANVGFGTKTTFLRAIRALAPDTAEDESDGR